MFTLRASDHEGKHRASLAPDTYLATLTRDIHNCHASHTEIVKIDCNFSRNIVREQDALKRDVRVDDVMHVHSFDSTSQLDT